MNKVAAGRPYIFQQDGVFAHTITRPGLVQREAPYSSGRRLSGPPSSPSCSHLGYLMWCVTERDVNGSAYMKK